MRTGGVNCARFPALLVPSARAAYTLSMAVFPSFILRRLSVGESLLNTAEGFETARSLRLGRTQ